MEIEGSARESRAREPRVEEAFRRRVRLRTRVRVERRSGRERAVDSGQPRSERSWVEKVSIAGRRSSLKLSH